MFHPNQIHTRILCWFLTGLMLITPSSHLLAQQVAPDAIELKGQDDKAPEAEYDTTLLADPAFVPVPDIVDTPLDVNYLLPQACLVVSLRPQAILASPFAKMMPIEVVQAASLQQTGLDPLQLDRLLLSIEPPAAGPPNYAVMGSFITPVVGKLHPQLTEHTTANEQATRPHLQSQHPLMPSLYFPADTVLLATPEVTLQKFLTSKYRPSESSLHERLLAAASDDVYVAIDVVPLRPLINGLLMQNPIPPQFQHFNVVPDLVKTIELRMNLSHAGTNELVIESNNDQDAEELSGLVEKSFDMIRSQTAAEIAQLKQNSDPVQQAMGRYQERMMNEMSAALAPQREGAKLIIFRQTGEQGQMGMLTMTAVSGILVALLLPAVQAAREAAKRSSSMNNLKQIMLALLNYESVHGQFPSQASFGTNGKPLLSWRVHILPFLEEQKLYDQFHLDEPWDSEHNKQLISKMPASFAEPSSKFAPQEGRTNYLGVKGKGMAFSGEKEGRKLREFSDGTSNSLIVLQVNDQRATTWTRPDDWELDPKNNLSGLSGSMHPGIFLAAYCDGSVRAISESIDPELFKALLTIAGGEVVQNP
ncbi:DUF1559 domain-containing protein [Bythopirellula polymerisocia]|uniref:DUF1559 domain-containing protein n=1 Tax=Bythopirellula polymerisocia TaxID=2528003 RepID=A0A5C6C9N1_9BACT|nr:DUF1559 domain-containing protein [Bythopirellula polymerisocia]TWU20825.1 hypothetical protein Pla144_48780 [Bythopirellula polymerisocia]